ncbi:MAG: deoxyribonuclease IV [Candidatus Izemoplasma sp.]|nr:deoxyribonuclease IV [Candidatus Izemoplasma sp.]
MLKIGSHVGMKGKEMFLGSVKEALSYGANALMIYTGAPQNTRRKPIDKLMIEEAHALMKEHNMHPEDVIVHAPYIMNLANKHPEKRAFAVDFLTKEIKRTGALGAKHLVLHPGAHVGQGPEVGIKYIQEGLNQAIENTKDLDVKIALETMAGKGTEVGRSFDELADIIDGIDEKDRISICFDTCHTHDAGYQTRDDFDSVLKEFDDKIGISRIGVIHVNDSKNILGAAKDRHENIGSGEIGFDALYYIVHHPKLKDVPKILETPYITETDDSKKKVYPPYKYEIDMFRKGTFDPNIKTTIRNQ